MEFQSQEDMWTAL